MFRLFFRNKAFRTFSKIDKGYQLKINAVLDDLKRDRFAWRHIEKIQGTESGYRLRVGRWRILFSLSFDKNQIEIVDIFLKKGEQDYKRRRKLL